MKKYLFGLLTFILIGLINFGNGFYLSYFDSFIATGTFTVPTITANYGFSSVYDSNNTNFKNYCVYIDNVSSFGDVIVRYDANSTRTSSTTIQGGYILEGSFYSEFDNHFNIFCTNGTRRYYGFSYPKASAGITFDYYVFDSTELNSILSYLEDNLSQCQTDLNLCQNSSCESDLLQCHSDYGSCSSSLGTCGTNLNSCQTALGNCMQGQIGTGVNWSSLFINGIQHVGKPLININIPEEINRDYINSGNTFDLDIEGYNVDTEYIEGVINLQNSKPNQVDFNNIITGIIPLFVPGLVIILFIYFIFRFLKKIF